GMKRAAVHHKLRLGPACGFAADQEKSEAAGIECAGIDLQQAVARNVKAAICRSGLEGRRASVEQEHVAVALLADVHLLTKRRITGEHDVQLAGLKLVAT